jgi:ribonuclease Z
VNRLRLFGLALVLAVAAFGWVLTCAAWRFDRVAAGVLPLDPRDFPRLSVVTLGTAGAHPDPNRRGPTIAVALRQDIVLVDVGRGVAEALRAAKIPAAQPGTILLTSLMPENLVGLDDLLAAAWLEGRSEPLRLYGPPGCAALARSLEAGVRPGSQALREAVALPGALPALEVVEVGDGTSLQREELSLRAGALPGGPVPALAWRFEWRGRSAVVSSAAWAPDELVELARGAQLLVHEAAFLPTPEEARAMGLTDDPERLRRDAALHTGLEAVGSLARRAGTDTLVLVRLRPPPVYHLQVTSVVDDTFDGRVIVAEDGDELTP